MLASMTKKATVEAFGTALLTATVLGSAVMAQRLSDGNQALALLANTLATGWGLFALISCLGGLSGAHFNPVVTVQALAQGDFPGRDVIPYVLAQLLGAVIGAILANALFGLPLLSQSIELRNTGPMILSEAVATFGLLLVIRGCGASNIPAAAPVAAYIAAGYWFTSSSAFANPALTIARMFTDSPAGISPASVPSFLFGQCLGCVAAIISGKWLFSTSLPLKKDGL